MRRALEHQSQANFQVRVRTCAAGIPGPDNFEIVEGPPPACPDDGVLVKVILAAVDPAMRGWLSAEANYTNVPPGAVMPAYGVGQVIESRVPGWAAEDVAFGRLGWQQFAAVANDALFWKVDLDTAPPQAWLSELGLNGLTAWLGLHHFGSPSSGETIVVSTAAGGVGSVVGQLARNAGLQTIGLTSSPAKAAVALRDFGYDHVIDYKRAPDLEQAVAEACPHGIDIFYDNTAGSIADAVFPGLNRNARIVQCGTAAVSSWIPAPNGRRRERDMLVKRLSWKGFVAFDHADLFPEAFALLKPLFAAGKLRCAHDILEGLERAPGAIERLYAGENTGRLLIRP